VRVCDEKVMQLWWMCDLRHRFGAILGSFLQTRGSLTEVTEKKAKYHTHESGRGDRSNPFEKYTLHSFLLICQPKRD